MTCAAQNLQILEMEGGEIVYRWQQKAKEMLISALGPEGFPEIYLW